MLAFRHPLQLTKSRFALCFLESTLFIANPEEKRCTDSHCNQIDWQGIAIKCWNLNHISKIVRANQEAKDWVNNQGHTPLIQRNTSTNNGKDTRWSHHIVRQRQHIRIAHAKIDLRQMENKNTDNQHQGIRNRQLERTSEEMFLNRTNITFEG